MSTLKIGWALRDVATDKPVSIPGQFYTRVSKGVLDPVTVTALTIEDNQDIVIFLSADLVVIRSHLLDDVRAKVREKNPQIPTEKILMNATHTHSAPSHITNDEAVSTGLTSECPHEGIEIASAKEYKNFLVEQAADAICEAYKKRARGGIAYGYGYAVAAHSRRVVYFDDVSKLPGALVNSTHGVDGHAMMYGNTNDNKFSHYEAGADHFANFLYTFDENNNLTGAIINVPCPSQCSEHEQLISADYWHDVRVSIRKEYGDIYILPQCAAAGDLSPRILHYKKAQQRRYSLKYGDVKIDPRVENVEEMYNRKDIAERICNAFSEVLSWAKKDIITSAPVRHLVKTINLSRRLITEEEYSMVASELNELEKKEFVTDGTPEENMYANSILAVQRNRCRKIIDRYMEQKSNPTLPMELHAVRIGDIAFASNRFELYMDFQHRIQARSPFIQTFIIQLAGQPGEDGGTYLATERAAWGKGYGASMYCNLVSPEGGQELVEATVQALNELYSK